VIQSDDPEHREIAPGFVKNVETRLRTMLKG
jgi:hypothetical protein